MEISIWGWELALSLVHGLQWCKEEEGIKDDLDLGVEQLVIQQLGR